MNEWRSGGGLVGERLGRSCGCGALWLVFQGPVVLLLFGLYCVACALSCRLAPYRLANARHEVPYLDGGHGAEGTIEYDGVEQTSKRVGHLVLGNLLEKKWV